MSTATPTGLLIKVSVPRFLVFCCVGCAGFAVDLSVSLLLVKVFSIQLLGARTASWLFAATTTFYLNSLFSFRILNQIIHNRMLLLRAYSSYLLSQSFGGLINIMVFMATTAVLRQTITAGVVFGTICGLIVNYLGARAVLLPNKRQL